MVIRISAIASVSVCAATLVMFAGCCEDSSHREHAQTTNVRSEQTVASASPNTLGDWPAGAEPGQCYAKAFIPPATRTVQQRVVVKEASERLEIVPAQYEWVEERVMTKEASKELVEVPAEYASENRTVVIQPAQTGWYMDTAGTCRTTDGQPAHDVFCYVNRPAVTKTVTSQRLVHGATTKQIDIPAEYQTVRRQKVATAAATRTITIPAEFDTVDTTLVTAPGRWEWQRVMCDAESNPVTVNTLKAALLAQGYQPGPFNGEMTDADWAAVKAYQRANGLGVGVLSYETLDHLQVAVK